MIPGWMFGLWLMAVAVVTACLVLAWASAGRLLTWLRSRIWYARNRRDTPARALDGPSLTTREWQQLGRIRANYNATDIPEPHYDKSGGPA
jgi:hypothetical protein